ncbi:ATPase [Neorhizobium lilium]|uniref:ATPase n=1 Tax=Neorhizobium lilium TaxID=2503024 RepID=A0A444LL24_9HYPH|nr:BadF/BadG/BcrA/BcrD ATPase family protein [Neorhizobium lilium]RWX81035.1 ATPase [Neorhizobium lilium]
MSYVLGLDGGGTKTLTALADRSGEVVEIVRGPSLDPTAAHDWPALLSRQLGQASNGFGAPAAAVLGLSFHDEIERFTTMQEEVAVSLLPHSKVAVENDVRIAFDGAFATGGGILLLAGTGSMAWASLNGPNDRHYRIGGWGDAFGDEGSAYWIGRESLAIASQALDGRLPEADVFAHELLRVLSISADGLIDWVYSIGNRRTAIAGISSLTAAMAESGSSPARDIINRACDHLARHVAAAERLLSYPEGQHPAWSYAGGVFSSSSILDGVCRRVGTAPVDPILPPVGGALVHAARLAGWDVDTGFVGRLSASLQNFAQSKTQRKGE